MRKIYSLFLFFFLGFLSKADGQIIIKNGSIDTCGGIFYDDTGETGTYRSNQTYTFTICSNQPGKSHIALGFNMIDIGDGDDLSFFDGNNTSAPLLATSAAIGSTQNAIIQTTVANRTGCMTVRFRARSRFFGNVFFKGWSANILCIPACQSLMAVIESTVPAVAPADTGWITACPSLTRVNFKAKGIYTQNGYRYAQNDTINRFEWNFGDGSTITYGTDVTHVFDKSGGYNVHLTITDTLGCQNTNYIKQRVKVSPKPTFNISNLPSQVCAGTEIKLKAKATGVDTAYQVSVKTNTGDFNVGGVRSGRLFIPDNPSQEYRTTIRFTDFAPGQTLTSINDLLSIFVDMEHSWARDLEIKLVCPSQKSVILHKYDVGTRNINEIHLGVPNENDAILSAQVNDSTYNPPGRGSKYEWVPTGATRTWRDFTASGIVKLPAGKYKPEDAMTKLLGCPLNGEWSLVVKDQFEYDNGWIFAWGINFNNRLYPGLESFTPKITEHAWVKNPYLTTSYSGDEMTVKPIHAGTANLTYRVKDDFNCVFDTAINIRVLPPTSLLCAACNIDTFFTKMRDTIVCVSGNNGVQLNKTPKSSPNLSIPFDAFPNVEIDANTNPLLSPFISKVPVSSIAPATVTNILSQIDSVCFDIGTFVSSDMRVELQSPSGQKITLFDQRGGIGYSMKNICFSPKASRSITTATPPFSGIYQPEGGVSTWNTLLGATVNGNWELQVSDARGANKDTINRWSITFINQNGFKYAWTPATGLSCTTCANPKATPSVSTTYKVVVTDSVNCTYTDTMRITVIDSLAAPLASVQNINFTFIIFDWLPVAGATGYQVSINNGPWILPNGTLSHAVRNLKIGDIVNFRVRATGSSACGAKIATLTQATRACVATIGNGFNRRLEIDSIPCFGQASPRVNFAYSNGIAPITYIIDSLTQPSLAIFINTIRAGNHLAIITDSTGCRDSLRFTTYHPSVINVALTPANTKCDGDDNGKVTALASGGVGNYSYRILGNTIGEFRKTAVFDTLAAGAYTVEVQDGNGCTGSAVTEVKSPPLLLVDLVKQDVRCFGEKTGVAKALTSGGLQPYIWNWDNGKKTEEIDSLAIGDYAVTVTDKNGCLYSGSINIDENQALLLTATIDSALCYDQASGRARINVSGGLAPYSYQWTNRSISDDNANLKAGTYKVTVTDGLGCSKTQSIVINQPDSLRFDSLVSSKTFCPNDATGTATAFVKGGVAPYSYEWNNANQKTQKAINLIAGPYSITVKDAKGCLLDGDVTVKANSAIVVDKFTIVSPLRCNGDATGRIDALISGGVGNYTYRWNTTPVQTTATALNLRAGKYTLSVTDANNCTIARDTTLGEPEKLDARVALFSNVKCKGETNGTATPSVSGGTGFPTGIKYVFQWNDPQNQVTAVAKDLGVGRYTLTVTDYNGCTDTANVTINEPALVLTAAVQQTKLACFNQNNGEAQVRATGGLGSYIYQWSNLQRTATATNLVKQKYSVTVSDINGCRAIDSVNISTYDSVRVSFAIAYPTCNKLTNGRVAVNGIIGGGGNGALNTYTYRWNTLPIQTTAAIANLPGNKLYVVSVVDNQGCETVAAQYILDPNPIVLSATAKDVACFGGTNGEARVQAVGDKPPFAYLWDAGANAQSVSNAVRLSTGRYKVTVTDAANCSVDTSITIGQPAGMKIQTQEITNTRCTDEATGKISVVVAGGTPTYNYSWSNGGAVANIQNLKSGRYDLVITDSKGCQLQETFTVKTPKGLDGDVSVSNVKCYGEANGIISVDAFGGTQPYLYSLGGKSYNGINQIVGVKAGNYEVFIQDANGCKWFDKVQVNQPAKFAIETINDVTINLGDSILLSANVKNSQGNVNISWLAPYEKTLSCVKCPNPMSKPMYTITYGVVGIDSAGCRAMDSLKITVVKPRYIAVPTAFTPNEDKVNDGLYVRGKEGTKILVYRVYDRWGELLYEAHNFKINDSNFGWDGTFKGQPMTSGVYVWYIEAEYIDGAKEILKGHTTLMR